jgi:hypothetical protein
VPDICRVELHCHAEGSHLMPDVHICSCKQPHALITTGLIRHSHFLLCPKAWIWCGWLLCIPENRCQNFSSRLTDFKLFASQRIWVLPLHFGLYCLRSEMVRPCLTACHCGFQELMSFFKPLKMGNSKEKMLIFCVLPSEIWTTSVQLIDMKLWLICCTKSVPSLVPHSHLHRCNDETVQWSSWISDNYTILCTICWHAAFSLCHHWTSANW